MHLKILLILFFYVELKNGVPNSEPVPVKIPLPEGLNGLYPSISKNGNIYFHARSNQTADIYVSRLNNNSYQTPEKLSFNTNEYNDYDAIISKDESFVIFVSSNRKGQGGSDLWISYQEENNQWSEPINLGKTINSAGNEGAPGLSPDNKTLFFSGTREIIQRDEWIRTGTKPSPSTILNTYKNGLMNIYQVSITDFLKQK